MVDRTCRVRRPDAGGSPVECIESIAHPGRCAHCNEPMRNRPEDELAESFARTYGFGEGMAPVRFEIMFSADGWIVGWVCEGKEHNTRIDQSPAIRVELGSLLQVRMPATGLLAVVLLDHTDRHWPVRLMRAP